LNEISKSTLYGTLQYNNVCLHARVYVYVRMLDKIRPMFNLVEHKPREKPQRGPDNIIYSEYKPINEDASYKRQQTSTCEHVNQRILRTV